MRVLPHWLSQVVYIRLVVGQMGVRAGAGAGAKSVTVELINLQIKNRELFREKGIEWNVCMS